MQHDHVILRKFHLFFGQNVEIFQTDIIFFVEETFFLYSCHIKNIQLAHGIF